MNENEEVESWCITYKKKWLSVTIQCIAFISIFEECFPSFGGVQKKKDKQKTSFQNRSKATSIFYYLKKKKNSK